MLRCVLRLNPDLLLTKQWVRYGPARRRSSTWGAYPASLLGMQRAEVTQLNVPEGNAIVEAEQAQLSEAVRVSRAQPTAAAGVN